MSSDLKIALAQLCDCLEDIKNDDLVEVDFMTDADTALSYIQQSEALSSEARHILDLLEENRYPLPSSAEGEQARRRYAEEVSRLHARAKQAADQMTS